MSLRFQHLVFDIQLYIVSHFLDTPELLSLVTVSHHYNQVATPALYARVSLLLHITKIPFQWTGQEDDADALRRSQGCFWETLMARPELARHVRTLEWQIKQPVPKQPFMWYASPDDTVYMDELFGTFLPLLRNVRKVHFTFSGGYHPVSTHVIQPLFPHVTSVKLVRPTSLNIIKAILHSPAQISELSLETICLPRAHTAIVDWLSETPFPSLRRLSLRYGPPDDQQELTEIFSVWRKFLFSVHHTLTDVLLGFKDPMPACVVDDHAGDAEVAPDLESRFMEMIAPIFIRVSWPELRVLELENVGKFKGPWSLLEDTIPRLVLGQKCRRIIECWDPAVEAKF